MCGCETSTDAVSAISGPSALILNALVACGEFAATMNAGASSLQRAEVIIYVATALTALLIAEPAARRSPSGSVGRFLFLYKL